MPACQNKVSCRFEAALLGCVYALIGGWLWQVLLTGEPALVSLAVMLLEVVLEHNGPALASLYQTGIFFFALAYCGSNLVEIGRLFKVHPFLFSQVCILLWSLGKVVRTTYDSPVRSEHHMFQEASLDTDHIFFC